MDCVRKKHGSWAEGNVIFMPVNSQKAANAEKEKRFLIAAMLYEYHNRIYDAMRCYVQADAYSKAAGIADRHGETELRNDICDTGIGNCHKLLIATGRKSSEGSEQKRFRRRAGIYKEMAELYRIKGERGIAAELKGLSRASANNSLYQLSLYAVRR